MREVPTPELNRNFWPKLTKVIARNRRIIRNLIETNIADLPILTLFFKGKNQSSGYDYQVVD
jgi:G:T-mismatch repair DNA endonuclease (very short patch repair protein)